MKTALIIAALALSGCLKLPTPAEICAMPPEVLAALAEEMQSTPADLTVACAVVK